MTPTNFHSSPFRLCRSTRPSQQLMADAFFTDETILDVQNEMILDVQKFIREREGLHARGEQARSLRDAGRLAEAEAALSALLSEAEDLCGEHSFHLADFLKSLGILFLKQGHVVKAEMTFVRMDLLRD